MPNTDGYRNNGLFGIDQLAEAKSKEGSQNDKFLYPPETIKFLAAQDFLDKKGTGTYPPYRLQRGYIRNLRQPALGDVPISKCQFQFNPQDIRQSVQMREDMYLAVLQDPAQLAQPIGAQMNFQFDLLFDRQMEVSRGEGGVDTGGSLTSADQIGVLADLRVFYEVIGQGLSEKMLASQTAALQAGATRVYGNSNPTDGTTNPDDGTTATTETPFSATSPESTANASTFLNASLNSGNAAFLMPNPVRLMFSSLFMLDGFVTATSVDFLKFSTKMVPVSCKVSVSMMAVYIGFARKDTFLTQQFQAASDAQDDANREDAEGSKELLAALKTTANSITFGFSRDDSVDNLGADLTPVRYAVMKNAGTYETGGGNVRAYIDKFIFRFDNVRPKVGQGEDIDDILNLYENDTQFTISYDWQCKIYGYGTSGVNGWQSADGASAALTIAAGSGDYTKGLSETVITNLDDAANIMLAGSYQGSATCSSKDEWGSGEKAGVRRLRISGTRGSKPELTNNAGAARDNVLGSGYYIVIWQLEVTAIVDGLQEHKRPATSVQYIAQVRNSTDGLYVTYNLNWE